MIQNNRRGWIRDGGIDTDFNLCITTPRDGSKNRTLLFGRLIRVDQGVRRYGGVVALECVFLGGNA